MAGSALTTPTAASGDMTPDDFRRAGHALVDWIAEYYRREQDFPVQPRVEPGALVDALPSTAPEVGEPIEAAIAEFERTILPHITHWNHPGFMAYFAAGGSAPGALAELLTAALNNVGLLWKTSPALAELEQVTLSWLRRAMKLPENWFGMILGTASTASLHAIIAAREAARQQEREAGRRFDLSRLTIYASEQAHSSIEKAMLTLGHGCDACRKIPTDAEFRMKPEALEHAIEEDLQNGFRPIAVVATVGTTSTSAVDPVAPIAALTEKFGLWLHVDAAYAGPAALLPEKRTEFRGCERAQSFLFNPHKWLFTPMDCTAFYTSRPEALRQALSLVPEYLRSNEHPRAVNFMEYSIPLGRRFRALKLWFILRYFGLEGIRERLRQHIRLAQWLAARIDEHPEFERMAPAPFSLVCFRWRPAGAAEGELDRLNEALIDAINRSREYFLSHTRLNGCFTIRVAIGNLRTQQEHVEALWKKVLRLTAELGL